MLYLKDESWLLSWNYFERKGEEYYVTKKNDLDSCSGSDLIKVIERFDEKEQQYFDS